MGRFRQTLFFTIHFFNRRGRIIFLWGGRMKRHFGHQMHGISNKLDEVKQNFGGVEHFIRAVKEIPGPSKSTIAMASF